MPDEDRRSALFGHAPKPIPPPLQTPSRRLPEIPVFRFVFSFAFGFVSAITVSLRQMVSTCLFSQAGLPPAAPNSVHLNLVSPDFISSDFQLRSNP